MPERVLPPSGTPTLTHAHATLALAFAFALAYAHAAACTIPLSSSRSSTLALAPSLVPVPRRCPRSRPFLTLSPIPMPSLSPAPLPPRPPFPSPRSCPKTDPRPRNRALPLPLARAPSCTHTPLRTHARTHAAVHAHALASAVAIAIAVATPLFLSSKLAHADALTHGLVSTAASWRRCRVSWITVYINSAPSARRCAAQRAFSVSAHEIMKNVPKFRHGAAAWEPQRRVPGCRVFA